ncbi:hypothetical protein IWQ60_001680 [Tieghemiomyces parasiticus]|uniref:Uncharacterized protein n=1 Tax=Tieghemiomyces parasiticus TaxID=78921 RepID=A0A9W8E1Q5_9FUNG|nr:hypothetical protein IWQ60_001680 [Tieghemiomyces parasiticus]
MRLVTYSPLYLVALLAAPLVIVATELSAARGDQTRRTSAPYVASAVTHSGVPMERQSALPYTRSRFTIGEDDGSSSSSDEDEGEAGGYYNLPNRNLHRSLNSVLVPIHQEPVARKTKSEGSLRNMLLQRDLPSRYRQLIHEEAQGIPLPADMKAVANQSPRLLKLADELIGRGIFNDYGLKYSTPKESLKRSLSTARRPPLVRRPALGTVVVPANAQFRTEVRTLTEITNTHLLLNYAHRGNLPLAYATLMKHQFAPLSPGEFRTRVQTGEVHISADLMREAIIRNNHVSILRLRSYFIFSYEANWSTYVTFPLLAARLGYNDIARTLLEIYPCSAINANKFARLQGACQDAKAHLDLYQKNRSVVRWAPKSMAEGGRVEVTNALLGLPEDFQFDTEFLADHVVVSVPVSAPGVAEETR